MFPKSFTLLLIIIILFAGACSQTTDPSDQTTSEEIEIPAPPQGDQERETVFVSLDGNPIKESGFSYTDINKALSDHVINDSAYYAAPITEIVGVDTSAVKGAFLEAVDGYISYVADINNLYLASHKAEDGQYKSFELDGKAVYGGVASGAKDNKGVVNVYLVTTPATFEVEIQKNGEKIGVLTLDQFLQKTNVGDQKVPTGMFEGSFMFNGGAGLYEGRFLGINYETMLAKLSALGMDLSGNIVEVEYYGTNGLKNEGKNFEYSTKEGDEKYFGSVEFFCMYDGKTFNNDTSDLPIGLTAFLNGTGGRWMTMNLTAINFIIE